VLEFCCWIESRITDPHDKLQSSSTHLLIPLSHCCDIIPWTAICYAPPARNPDDQPALNKLFSTSPRECRSGQAARDTDRRVGQNGGQPRSRWRLFRSNRFSRVCRKLEGYRRVSCQRCRENLVVEYTMGLNFRPTNHQTASPRGAGISPRSHLFHLWESSQGSQLSSYVSFVVVHSWSRSPGHLNPVVYTYELTHCSSPLATLLPQSSLSYGIF